MLAAPAGGNSGRPSGTQESTALVLRGHQGHLLPVAWVVPQVSNDRVGGVSSSVYAVEQNGTWLREAASTNEADEGLAARPMPGSS